ncbi:hypothetical protein [Bounagaea algeriensis]
MRSLVRGAVATTFGLTLALGGAGVAAAGGGHHEEVDVDACQVVSCNVWNWHFSDDDMQGMNFGSVLS